MHGLRLEPFLWGVGGGGYLNYLFFIVSAVVLRFCCSSVLQLCALVISAAISVLDISCIFFLNISSLSLFAVFFYTFYLIFRS